MTEDISAMAFWKAAGPYSDGVSHRFTDSPHAIPTRCAKQIYYIVRPPHANVEDRPPYEHRSGLKNPTTLT